MFIWIFASYRNTLYEALEKIGEDHAKATPSYLKAKFESKKNPFGIKGNIALLSKDMGCNYS